MAKISHSNPDLDDVYTPEEVELEQIKLTDKIATALIDRVESLEVIGVQESITWQQIEQLNLSYGTLLEIIAELVNGETSIEDAREKILDGELD